MDWSRAKSILIGSFLLLNMLLFYQLWTARTEQGGTPEDVNLQVEETRKILQRNQISVTGDIPRDAPKLKLINVMFDENVQPGQKLSLTQPFKYSPLPGRGSKDNDPRSIIKGWDLYQWDPAGSKKDMIVFNQMYGNVPLFDVKLEFYEEKEEIVAYRQALVEVQLITEQEQQKVIPAYTAIRRLAESLPKGSVITEVRLGYHGQNFSSQLQSNVPLWPFWRVTLNNGEIYYIHGFNGAVEPFQEPARSE